MGTKITLGQFIPGNSPVHLLDPRTKILLMIAYIVLCFLPKTIFAFIVPFAFIIMTLLIAQIPVHYVVSSVKPIRFLLIFMFLINLFFTQGESILFEVWIIRITRESLHQAVFITLRLLFLVMGTSLLTLTTSPIALTDGIEQLLKPLTIFHFPAHELAMMMSIALRFIPTLMEEVDRIQKAQAARGADFTSGNLIQRAKNMLPILVPLFVSAFRRADELAMAMESRCYHGGDGRTKMHELKMQRNDWFAFLIMALYFAATILLSRVVL